jgi:hypothetical protein
VLLEIIKFRILVWLGDDRRTGPVFPGSGHACHPVPKIILACATYFGKYSKNRDSIRNETPRSKIHSGGYQSTLFYNIHTITQNSWSSSERYQHFHPFPACSNIGARLQCTPGHSRLTQKTNYTVKVENFTLRPLP